MPKKIYVVTLSDDERSRLTQLVEKGTVLASKRRHAQVLLKADQGPRGEAWSDKRIAEVFDLHRCTVENIRKRLVFEGLEAAIDRKAQSNRHRLKVDGHIEARLIALACQAPPEGRLRWTMSLLAERLVQLELVGSVSDETVRRVLKKTNSSRG